MANNIQDDTNEKVKKATEKMIQASGKGVVKVVQFSAQIKRMTDDSLREFFSRIEQDGTVERNPYIEEKKRLQSDISILQGRKENFDVLHIDLKRKVEEELPKEIDRYHDKLAELELQMKTADVKEQPELSKQISVTRLKLDESVRQMNDAKTELKKKFPFELELKEKTDRLSFLDIHLGAVEQAGRTQWRHTISTENMLNSGSTIVEVNEKLLPQTARDFLRSARKHNLHINLTKDRTTDPPTYSIFMYKHEMKAVIDVMKESVALNAGQKQKKSLLERLKLKQGMVKEEKGRDDLERNERDRPERSSQR